MNIRVISQVIIEAFCNSLYLNNFTIVFCISLGVRAFLENTLRNKDDEKYREIIYIYIFLAYISSY